MSARERRIDRVAHAMTAGAPGDAFTARVMAPIRGVPQPGFTGRVMARIDTPRPFWKVSAQQLVLAGAAALALAAGAMWWLPGSLPLQVAPEAPRVAASPLGGFQDASLHKRMTASTTHKRRPHSHSKRLVQTRSVADAPADTAAPPATPVIYVIEQLPAPAALAVPALEAPPRTTPPLRAPSVLRVPEIRINPFREET